MTANTFNAPWGRRLKVMTTLVLILLVGVQIVVQFSLRNVPPKLASHIELIRWLVAVISLGAVPIAGLFTVLGYELSGSTLLVRRPLWTTRVDLRGLTNAERDPEACSGAIRLFGGSGLFSDFGLFYSKRLGRFSVYATDYHNSVILKTPQKTVLITPGDPAGFVAAVKQSN